MTLFILLTVGESTPLCFMHAGKQTRKEKAAFKMKSGESDMRSTWNMRQAAGTIT